VDAVAVIILVVVLLVGRDGADSDAEAMTR
jgi:hypothetical protein